jgi:hypothetical protein
VAAAGLLRLALLLVAAGALVAGGLTGDFTARLAAGHGHRGRHGVHGGRRRRLGGERRGHGDARRWREILRVVVADVVERAGRYDEAGVDRALGGDGGGDVVDGNRGHGRRQRAVIDGRRW